MACWGHERSITAPVILWSWAYRINFSLYAFPDTHSCTPCQALFWAVFWVAYRPMVSASTMLQAIKDIQSLSQNFNVGASINIFLWKKKGWLRAPFHKKPKVHFIFENKPLQNESPLLRHSQNPLILRKYPWRLMTLSKHGSWGMCPNNKACQMPKQTSR